VGTEVHSSWWTHFKGVLHGTAGELACHFPSGAVWCVFLFLQGGAMHRTSPGLILLLGPFLSVLDSDFHRDVE
jgi:hypothetical protein